MQIAAIETFLAIDAAGSFHAAARILNVTQTTVSARVRALETAVGSALFERGPGGTRLSEAGRQFRPHAEQMMRIWDYASTNLSGDGENRLTLRLGSQLSMWDPLLVDVAVWLERALGKVPFTLNYDHTLDMSEAIGQRLLDVAIVNDIPRRGRPAVEDLPAERLLLVASKPMNLRDRVLPLFINLEFGAEYEAQLNEILPRRSHQHIVLGNAAMGLRYLLLRGGMGFFPAAMVNAELRQGRLFPVAGAPEMKISCRALYLRDNPAMSHVEQAIEGLHLLRKKSA